MQWWRWQAFRLGVMYFSSLNALRHPLNNLKHELFTSEIMALYNSG